MLGVGVGQRQGPLLTALPDHARGVYRGEDVRYSGGQPQGPLLDRSDRDQLTGLQD